MKKTRQLISLLLCFALMSAIAVINTGKWLGHDFRESTQQTETGNDTIYHQADGSEVINTTYLAKDVMGYGGPVPLKITIQDNTITDIQALPNDETPEFFASAAVIFEKYKGKTVDDAVVNRVDAVSGATFSSRAITENVQRAMEYYQRAESVNDTQYVHHDDPKTYCAILVMLLAAVVPLFTKNKKVRTVQLFLNVGVLGFWCGAFMSYTSMLNVLTNGISITTAPVALISIVIAFVYPLFGKPSYYCTHVCPFGSLQALAGKCNNRKWHLTPHLAKRLDLMRKVLWVVLNACLLTGVWISWVDYEPFTAFIFQSASTVAIVIAVVFFILSFFISRPYCRFVCPTGTLLKYCQKR